MPLCIPRGLTTTASYVQVLVAPYVLLFAFLWRLEIFSWRLVFVITLISAGVALMGHHRNCLPICRMSSASAFGGLRWNLTQILFRKRNMRMDTPVATVYWLAPVMGFTLAFVSMAIEGWGNALRLLVWMLRGLYERLA